MKHAVRYSSYRLSLSWTAAGERSSEAMILWDWGGEEIPSRAIVHLQLPAVWLPSAELARRRRRRPSMTHTSDRFPPLRGNSVCMCSPNVGATVSRSPRIWNIRICRWRSQNDPRTKHMLYLSKRVMAAVCVCDIHPFYWGEEHRLSAWKCSRVRNRLLVFNGALAQAKRGQGTLVSVLTSEFFFGFCTKRLWKSFLENIKWTEIERYFWAKKLS